MVAIPRAPFRPVWVPIPFRVRARTGLAWAAVSGVLAVVLLVLVARLGNEPSALTVAAVIVLLVLVVAAVIAAVLALVAAVARGPGDGMSVYGPGRRVEVTWASRRREWGRVAVEDVGHGEVVALLPRDSDQPSHVTVRLGTHDLLLQGGPGPTEPEWYTVVDDDGYTLARADASPGPVGRGLVGRHAPVDWTVWPAHGPVLRLRHGRSAQPTQVTLLDETGSAWWVRDGRLAELPDALDPVSAVFVVLLVDQLGRNGAARP